MRPRCPYLIAFVLAAVGLAYAFAAMQRINPSECRRRETEGVSNKSRQMGGAPLYEGQICAVGMRPKYLFRLYDKNTGSLVAERSFYDNDPGIIWGDRKVWYGGDEEFVELPPTLWDRFTAKLP